MSLRAYLANVRWGQVLFGALFALLAVDVWRRVDAGDFAIGTALRIGGLILVVLVFWVYLTNLYKHGLVPDYSLKCRYCLGPVNRYSEFCEHCGGDLIAEEKLVACRKCGAEVYEGTKHCPECGASILKGGKGKRARVVDEPKEGWDEPVDAVSGFPPDERR